MNIALDLDGCLYDFTSCIREWLHEHSDIDPVLLAQEPTDWHFYEAWGLTREEFDDVCHDAADAGHLFASQPPNYLDLAAMRQAINAGYELHLVTARFYGSSGVGLESEANTRMWLARWNVPHTSLRFTVDKAIGADVGCEDRVENADDMHAGGTETWLIDRPWNRHGHAKYPRAESVADFLTRVAGT